MRRRLQLRKVERLHWLMAAAAALAALAFGGAAFAAAVAVGAVLGAANLRAQWLGAERDFATKAPIAVEVMAAQTTAEKTKAAAAVAMGGLGVRFALMAAVLAAALALGLHPVGLVLGVSLCFSALLISAVLYHRRRRRAHGPGAVR